ncbi:MAG: asparagine synthase C-terminal domain-containing protein [Promethearchaeota archaeon]
MNADPCIHFSHQLYDLLTKMISQNLTSSIELGVLFSGGLDSSVITAILTKLHPAPFQLFVAGIEAAKDINFARKAAEALNLQLTIQLFTAADVEEALPTILSVLETVDVLHVELAIPLFFAAKCASQFKITTLFSGQGADELFGGYAKYEKRFLNSEESTLNEMKSDLLTLYDKTLPSMTAIVSHFNARLIVPFCEQPIKNFADLIPFSCKIAQISKKVIRKRILRLLARNLNLPSQIADAPKRALQYGSGTHRILSRLATSYWLKKNPKLSKRKTRTHARIEQYLTQFTDT